MLPTSLAEAVSALDKDEFYRAGVRRQPWSTTCCMMKRAELKRYEAALADNPPAEGQDVTDWEMREYFEFF